MIESIERILVIANKNATNGHSGEIDTIRDVYESIRGIDPDNLVFEITKSKDDLEAAANEHKKFKPDVIVYLGGDMTVTMTYDALFSQSQHKPNLEIAHALGMMCNFAIPTNANGGLIDLMKRKVGYGDTRAVKLAHYVKHCIEKGEEPKTMRLAHLKANGQTTMNIGFGLAQGLLRVYDGGDIRDEQKFMATLRDVPSDQYQEALQDHLKQSGKSKEHGSYRAFNAVSTGVKGCFLPNSTEREFFFDHDDLKFQVDGNPYHSASTGMTIAAYTRTNVGPVSCSPRVIPGAEKNPDKMYGAAISTEPSRVPSQIPRMWLGKANYKADYFICDQVDVTSNSGSPVRFIIDGDQAVADFCRVTHEGTRTFLCLPTLTDKLLHRTYS